MGTETTNKILRVLLPIAAILMVVLAILKESWFQLLMLPIILLVWYNSYQPVGNKTDNAD